MRSKTIFGALLVSVALCSQGFGFELLDRMLGLNCGGCGECNACAKVTCCDPCTKACCPEPACCAKPHCCEKACCDPCGKCCRPTPVRDLFADIAHLFECKGCYCEPACCPEKGCCPEPCAKACCDKGCCDPCCEPSCKHVKRCRKVRHCGDKGCCEPQCCEPQCCEPQCCEPKCHKLYRRPLVELLEAMFGGRHCGLWLLRRSRLLRSRLRWRQRSCCCPVQGSVQRPGSGSVAGSPEGRSLGCHSPPWYLPGIAVGPQLG